MLNCQNSSDSRDKMLRQGVKTRVLWFFIYTVYYCFSLRSTYHINNICPNIRITQYFNHQSSKKSASFLKCSFFIYFHHHYSLLNLFIMFPVFFFLHFFLFLFFLFSCEEAALEVQM